MEHKSTREKLSNMSKKEKASYIWDYYRYHIIGTLVAVVLIISLVGDILDNKESVLTLSLMGKTINSEKIEEFKNKASIELIKDDPKNKKEIRLDFLQTSDDPTDQYTLATQQKLLASIAAKEVDILILNRDDFQKNVDEGMFLRLDSLPQFSSIDFKGYELFKKNNEVYGVNAQNIPFLKELEYDTNGKVICIVSNTTRLDKAVEFLKLILK